jgi:hypothetical protein
MCFVKLYVTCLDFHPMIGNRSPTGAPFGSNFLNAFFSDARVTISSNFNRPC